MSKEIIIVLVEKSVAKVGRNYKSLLISVNLKSQESC